jgi:predicted RNA-binding Zn-ribbon protein involved in translation (DUF1610 family)
MNLQDYLKNVLNVSEEKLEGTFKCPNCGTKVLRNTGYCLKCKKKVAEK